MQNNISSAVVALVAGLVLAGPARAHHSTVAFDYSKVLSMQATVKRFEWTNPHAHLIVVPEGQTSEVRLETGTVANNARDGWTSKIVQVGDKVSIVYSPMRDGSLGGTLRTLTLPNGQVLKGAASYFGTGAAPFGPQPSSAAPPPAAQSTEKSQ